MLDISGDKQSKWDTENKEKELEWWLNNWGIFPVELQVYGLSKTSYRWLQYI